MIKVELVNASNGIIKKITDTQFDGADRVGELTKIYEFLEDSHSEHKEKIILFLKDIVKDLAIESGSDYSSSKLDFNFVWGSKYNPSLDEIKSRIAELKKEIRVWQEYKKVIENNLNVNNI